LSCHPLRSSGVAGAVFRLRESPHARQGANYLAQLGNSLRHDRTGGLQRLAGELTLRGDNLVGQMPLPRHSMVGEVPLPPDSLVGEMPLASESPVGKVPLASQKLVG